MIAANFDPNSAAKEGSGIFSLPFEEKDAALVYLPVPWEATTSYGGGTAKAPSAILKASLQVDLFDSDVLKPYEAGLFCLPESKTIQLWNRQAKAMAQKVIVVGGAVSGNKKLQQSLKTVNELSARLNEEVYRESRRLMDSGKILALIGGDHSAPYGAIKAASEKFRGFGLLHFDAHHDMRKAYEGFTHSHASILYNVIETLPDIAHVVQVGIRDYCEQEANYVQSKQTLVSVFYDSEIKASLFRGEPWQGIVSRIISHLPEEVWITFDIDALDPRLCPHTGTPVPGGLDFDQAVFVIAQVAQSGRKIVGFDLNEVSPGPQASNGEWDANVGARLLYKMSAWTLASQGLRKIRR
jgi:agmatinase